MKLTRAELRILMSCLKSEVYELLRGVLKRKELRLFILDRYDDRLYEYGTDTGSDISDKQKTR